MTVLASALSPASDEAKANRAAHEAAIEQVAGAPFECLSFISHPVIDQLPRIRH